MREAQVPGSPENQSPGPGFPEPRTQVSLRTGAQAPGSQSLGPGFPWELETVWCRVDMHAPEMLWAICLHVPSACSVLVSIHPGGACLLLATQHGPRGCQLCAECICYQILKCRHWSPLPNWVLMMDRFIHEHPQYYSVSITSLEAKRAGEQRVEEISPHSQPIWRV